MVGRLFYFIKKKSQGEKINKIMFRFSWSLGVKLTFPP